MGKDKDKQVSQFQLEGQFLGFEVEDGYKIKRLNLATPTGDYSIKLSQESRASIGKVLHPGDRLQVVGERQLNLKTGAIKFKAVQVRVIASGMEVSGSGRVTNPLPMVAPDVPAQRAGKQSSILVCQKSDCWKRGGKAVCRVLEQTLSDRGLTAQVVVKTTGCMKQCKAGPNIVFMPDKTRYSRVDPALVPALVDEHFPAVRSELECEPISLYNPVAVD